MTNQQQGAVPPPISPPPPAGYWLLHLPRAAQVRASEAAKKRAAKRFVGQVKFGVDKLIRRDPDSGVRLAQYRQKPKELWYDHRAVFPDCGAWWDFTHTMQDWQNLAPIDPARDALIQWLADEELRQEALAQQQAQMEAQGGIGQLPPGQGQSPPQPEAGGGPPGQGPPPAPPPPPPSLGAP